MHALDLPSKEPACSGVQGHTRVIARVRVGAQNLHLPARGLQRRLRHLLAFTPPYNPKGRAHRKYRTPRIPVPTSAQHTQTVTHNTPPTARLRLLAHTVPPSILRYPPCTRACLYSAQDRRPPCPVPPPVIKPYKSAPRDTLRMGLPSKGRMAEDTMQLLRVCIAEVCATDVGRGLSQAGLHGGGHHASAQGVRASKLSAASPCPDLGQHGGARPCAARGPATRR